MNLIDVTLSTNEHGDKVVRLRLNEPNGGATITGYRYPLGSSVLGYPKGFVEADKWSSRAPTSEEWDAAKAVAFSAKAGWQNWKANGVGVPARDSIPRGKSTYWEDDEQREGL